MNKSLLTFLFFIILLFPQISSGRDIQQTNISQRPKIGLVLSGGGAKGFAHVAVLRILEDLNIPIDYIGGTSMGATVAALYSMGYTVAELEQIAYKTNWNSFLNNEIKRSKLDSFNKHISDRYPIRLGITEKWSPAPKGLVNGHKIGIFLSRLTREAHNISDYSKLPIPFICIATDIETGKNKIMKGGFLAESLRATMAIPSLFEPVQIKGRLYLDGGIVNNLPAKEVRDMGADIVIGIDVGAPLYKKEELDSLPRIMEQSISFLGDRKTEEQRKQCDILILPDISQYSATSFNKTSEIYQEGKEAAQKVMPRLIKLSEQMKKYKIPVKHPIHKPEKDKFKIIRIKTHGLKKTSGKLAKEILNIKPGTSKSIEEIEDSINHVYGTKYYERISYRLVKKKPGYTLHLTFKESPENHLYVAINYDKEMKTSLKILWNCNNLFLKNSKAFLMTSLGDYPEVTGSYIINSSGVFGTAFGITTTLYNMDFFVYDGDKKTESYDFWDYTAGIYSGISYSNWIHTRIGIKKEVYYIEAEIKSPPDDETYNFDLISYFGELNLDTLDRYFYPRRGISLDFGINYVRPDLAFKKTSEINDNFFNYLFSLRFSIPVIKKVSIEGRFYTSFSSEDKVPPSYMFAMGGYQRYQKWIFPLAGYDFMQYTGSHGWTYHLNLQYEFIRDYFLILKWNEGKATSDYRDIFKYKDTRAGFGLTLAKDSFLGPIEISLFKKREKNDYTFHFNLGRTF